MSLNKVERVSRIIEDLLAAESVSLSRVRAGSLISRGFESAVQLGCKGVLERFFLFELCGSGVGRGGPRGPRPPPILAA